MSMEWIRHDHRLDVELAVALEVGARGLSRARSHRQMEDAITFNLRLWRAIRALALRWPSLCDREVLVDTADHVATMLVVDAAPCPDPRDMAFVAGRNLALARDLAGEVASEVTLGRLIDEWTASGMRSFEHWLLGRFALAA